MIVKAFLIFCLSEALALRPSPGCDKTLPEEPRPGKHHRFFFVHEDVQLGPVERDYIVQIPKNFDNTKPVPLVFDIHWYAGSAPSQVRYSPWGSLALEKDFLVVWPNGMNDSPLGSGSWNVSSTMGSKGPICDLNRENWTPPNECFESCPLCDDSSSCDWTTCYDDIGFLERVIEVVKDSWCVDLDQFHMSGISNGGMLLWNIASYVPDAFGVASFNTIAASPQLGYGIPPLESIPISFIDMHGSKDETIPSNLNTAFGPSPVDGLMSKHGSYFEDKQRLLSEWAAHLGCSDSEEPFETPYDGRNDFECYQRQCPGKASGIVRCFGDWGHEYPVSEHEKYVTAEVAYDFMLAHPRG